MSVAIAIEAVAARTALGADLDATCAALASGETAVSPVRGFDASAFGAADAAELPDDAAGPEDDPTLRILGPHGQWLESVLSSLAPRAVARDRLGLYVALGMVDSPVEDLAPSILASRDGAARFDLARFFGGGYRAIHPLWPLSMLGNVAVGQLAIDLDLRGDNVVLASQADAGVRALLEARGALLEGATDTALVAAASERVSPASLARRRLRGISIALGDGAAPGEGAAACRLRREADAEAPLLRLLGGATTFGPADGRSGPSRHTIERAIDAACHDAGTQTRAVGPWTVLLDGGGGAREAEDERQAVAATLGEDATTFAFASRTGHLGPASPVLATALAARFLAGARLDAGPAPGDPTAARVRPGRAIVLALSSEGAAGALVLEGAR